ncbi:tannase and feruloyl esterase-domain-containing protein [Aspergillus carlsbadensis]|nr:tannase and feruloyl esterase-domain-containing protein [Aspergillus carlsbadensis]
MGHLNLSLATLLWAVRVSRGVAWTYPPAVACNDLVAPAIDGASAVSITTAEINSAVCDVNITLTHGHAADKVRIATYLPLVGYNGRFRGLGGGGMVAAASGAELAAAAAQGFAAGATDAGRANATVADDTWGGDEQLLVNFAYLSVHEMTVVGKALAGQFYGRPVDYAYWSGCSNGGRQGYEEAQRYPEDYDGILANAPGISWDRFLVTDVHPYLVEVDADDFPPACVWEAITAASTTACDGLDGGRDGMINLPWRCRFDARETIGRGARGCPWRLHLGRASPGTNFTSLAAKRPFSIARAWIAAFVEGNPDFDVATISLENLGAEVQKSERMYRHIIGGDNPDLSRFRDAGGKLLTWHGLADQLIPAYGTIDYRLRVEKLLGGNRAVNDFYRLFLALGVDLGIGVGLAQLGAPVLVTELCHPKERVEATSLYNTLIYMGMIIGAWMAFGTVRMESDWSWKLPCLLQMVCSSYQIFFIWLCPESPRWLIAKGRSEEAEAILSKYHADGDRNSDLVKWEMSEMVQAIEIERANQMTILELLQDRGFLHRALLAICCGTFSQTA